MSNPHGDPLRDHGHDPGQHRAPTPDPAGQPGGEQTQAVDPAELPDGGASTTLREERTDVGTELHESGSVRAHKHVETLAVEQTVPREVEHADTERHDADAEDSGEVLTLEDGSISIPVFEEVLVVTKKLVVRERIVVRKHTVVDEYTLQTELRREHVTVDADEGVEVEDRTGRSGPTA